MEVSGTAPGTALEAHAPTLTVQEQEKERLVALEGCVLFALLSPFSNEVHDLLHRLKLLKEVKSGDLPVLEGVLDLFTSVEIIGQPFLHQDELLHMEALTRAAGGDATKGDYFSTLLRTRLIQHNIRVLAAYYDRIRLVRAAELLGTLFFFALKGVAPDLQCVHLIRCHLTCPVLSYPLHLRLNPY